MNPSKSSLLFLLFLVFTQNCGSAKLQRDTPIRPDGECRLSLFPPKITMQIEELKTIQTIPKNGDEKGSPAKIHLALHNYESYLLDQVRNRLNKKGVEVASNGEAEYVLDLQLHDFAKIRTSELYKGIGASILVGLGIAYGFGSPAVGAEVIFARVMRILTAPYIFATFVSTVSMDAKVYTPDAKLVFSGNYSSIHWLKDSRTKSLKKDLKDVANDLASDLGKLNHSLCHAERMED